MNKVEIDTYDDVLLLVRQFYARVLQDELLAPFFAGLDIEHHLGRIADFWALILIDREGYRDNVFAKHEHMAIRQEHFDRWIALFCGTVDEYFTGEKAELAKQRARLLAHTFMNKMGRG
jgi:hemoglobin